MNGIDLTTSEAEKCNLLCQLQLLYIEGENYSVTNQRENLLVMLEEPQSKVLFNDDEYKVLGMWIRLAPWIRLDGIRQNVEVILVHQSTINIGKLLFIHINGVVDNQHSKTDSFFKEISLKSPEYGESKVGLRFIGDFTLNDIVPDIKSFYNFKSKKERGIRSSKGVENSEDYSLKGSEHIIFTEPVNIYYEYYIKIKKLLRVRTLNYAKDNTISLFYSGNRKLIETPDLKQPNMFIKCRKVRKHIIEPEVVQDEIIVETDLPPIVEEGFKSITWVLTRLFMILLSILLIKLMNRDDVLKELGGISKKVWDKTASAAKTGAKLTGKGASAIKSGVKSGVEKVKSGVEKVGKKLPSFGKKKSA